MTAPRGVCPVIEVPFDDSGSIDTESFVSAARHLVACGVPAIMFPGYASEFYKLDEDERRTLTGLLSDTLRGTGTRLILSVSEHATLPALRRVELAREAGADLLNLLPPSLGRPGAGAILAHLDAVLAAAGDLPVVLQYAPAETGVALSPAEIALMRDRNPALVAVKVDASPAGPMIAGLTGLPEPIPVFVGYAGLHLLDAFERGAAGVWPGCSFAELYLRLWNLLDTGDETGARLLHRRMAPYLTTWMQSVEMIVAVEKEISFRRGLIATAHCRTPAYRLDGVDQRTVSRFLDDFGDELRR